jgi:hypothetical protein
MKNMRLTLTAAAAATCLMLAVSSVAAETNAVAKKPGIRSRVIISSDFPPVPGLAVSSTPLNYRSDPDDIQSMVRFLLYVNDLDVEGLIASSATLNGLARKKSILEVLDLYDKVDENLRLHDPRYPTADKLRSITWEGRSGCWGKGWGQIGGEGRDSEASDEIIKVVDKPDPRPVWVCVWGGPREVGQAIWKVQKSRSPAELEKFLSKLRIFLIANQDGSADWMKQNFPNLFIISSGKTYFGFFGGGSDPDRNVEWVNKHLRENHGPLGAIYPTRASAVSGVQEGDSPSFMYLVSAAFGMNDPEDPTQPSWGGEYKRDGSSNHWGDGPGGSSISKWKSDFQADFAKRADWMVAPKKN